MKACLMLSLALAILVAGAAGAQETHAPPNTTEVRASAASRLAAMRARRAARGEKVRAVKVRPHAGPTPQSGGGR